MKSILFSAFLVSFTFVGAAHASFFHHDKNLNCRLLSYNDGKYKLLSFSQNIDKSLDSNGEGDVNVLPWKDSNNTAYSYSVHFVASEVQHVGLFKYAKGIDQNKKIVTYPFPVQTAAVDLNGGDHISLELNVGALGQDNFEHSLLLCNISTDNTSAPTIAIPQSGN